MGKTSSQKGSHPSKNPNPFETRKNASSKKTKAVLGKHIKGADRNVALARQKALQKREQQLLPEYKRRDKANVFKDKRLGAAGSQSQGSGMTEEEKMLKRFQKERAKQLRKKAKFNMEEHNLMSKNGDTEMLTHRGSALGDTTMTDTSHQEYGDDDGIDADVVEQLHFGGGGEGRRNYDDEGPLNEGAAERKRTHREIMAEVIQKSKEYKEMKRQEKLQHEKQLETLDSQLDEVQNLLQSQQRHTSNDAKPDRLSSSNPDTSTSAAGGKKRARIVDIEEETPNTAAETHKRTDATHDTAVKADDSTQRKRRKTNQGIDEYDELVRTLAKESRAARATDRTKTEAELAKEELDRLQELEALRQKRMGMDDQPDVDDPVNEKERDRNERSMNLGNKIQWNIKAFSASVGGETDVNLAQKKTGDDEEGGGSDSDSAEEAEDVDEAGLDYGSDLEEDEDDSQKEDDRSIKTKSVSSRLKGSRASLFTEKIDIKKLPVLDESREEMPYVFVCPSTLFEWLGLVRQYCAYTEKDGNIVLDKLTLLELIRRVHASNAIEVKPTNKDKLLGWYKVLLEYITLTDGVQPIFGHDTTKQYVSHFQHAECAFPFLFKLTQKFTLECVQMWQTLLKNIFTRISETLSLGHPALLNKSTSDESDWHDYALGKAHPAWPSWGELLLMKVACSMYPVTDFQHPILTPITLLLGQALSYTPVVSLRDVSHGTVCATLLAEMSIPSGRIVPEVLSWLYCVFCCLSPPEKRLEKGLHISLPTFAFDPKQGRFRQRPTLNYQKKTKSSSGNIQFRPAPWLGNFLEEWLKRNTENSGHTEDEVDPQLHLDVLTTSQKDDKLSKKLAPGAASGVLSSSYKLIQSIVAGSFPNNPDDYRHNPAIPECLDLLIRILNVFDSNAQETLRGSSLHRIHSETLSKLKCTANVSRTIRGPIRMQAKKDKPIPLKTFEPEVDQNFAPGKLPPSATSAQHRKAEVRALQRAVKREQRGAARELRLDAQYLTSIRDQEKAEREAERETKYKEMQHLLETQQASVNKLAREGITRGGGTRK